jgi:hypothetical protein
LIIYNKDKPEKDRVKVNSQDVTQLPELYSKIEELSIPISVHLKEILERPNKMIDKFLKYFEAVKTVKPPEKINTEYTEQLQGFAIWKKVSESTAQKNIANTDGKITKKHT